LVSYSQKSPLLSNGINEFTVTTNYDLSTFFENVEIVQDEFYEYYIGNESLSSNYTKKCDNSNGDGFIFRVNKATLECVVIRMTELQWNLYNKDNSAKGVSINGILIDNEKSDKTFQIDFICPHDGIIYYPSNTIVEAVVMRDSKNVYHINLESAWYCPRECINENGHGLGVNVCSGHGLCIEDMFIGYPHCRCDGHDHDPIEWADDFCGWGLDSMSYSKSESSSQGASSDSAEGWIVDKFNNHKWMLVIIIMGSVLCLICLIAGVVLRRQTQKIREMTDEYNEFVN